MLIATCFGCTLYYFYALSGTNLLTRCQSASSLFSAVFGFTNPTRKISSESGEIFSSVNKRSGSFRSPEGTWGGAPRAPHPRRARPKVGPRRARVWGPHQAPGAHPSPIYSPRRKNPNTKDHLQQKVPSWPSSSITDRGSSDVLPGTLPEGKSSPEASTSSCLPPEWCVSSSSRDYGSIAVARWLSLYLVLSCLDLVSCLS